MNSLGLKVAVHKPNTVSSSSSSFWGEVRGCERVVVFLISSKGSREGW